MYKIQVLKDGEPVKFKRGKEEVEVIEADNFLFITDTENGNFSVDSNNLKTHEILGRLDLASYQEKQNFRARNYGTIIKQAGN